MNMFTRRRVTWTNKKMSYQVDEGQTGGKDSFWIPALRYSINTVETDKYMAYNYSFCFSCDINGSYFNSNGY